MWEQLLAILRRVSTSCLITWLLHIKVSLPVVRYSWIKHWIDCGRGGGRGRSPDRDHSGACLLPDSEKEVGGRILWVFTTFLNHLTIKIIFISTTIGMQYVLISFYEVVNRHNICKIFVNCGNYVGGFLIWKQHQQWNMLSNAIDKMIIIIFFKTIITWPNLILVISEI